MLRRCRTKQLFAASFLASVFLVFQNMQIPRDQLQKLMYLHRRSVFINNITQTATDSAGLLHNAFDEKTNLTVPPEKVSDGYKLAERANLKCHGSTSPKYAKTVKVFEKYETKNGDTQVCPIWKIGTTFLKRLFMVKTQSQHSHLINPYDIPYDTRYKAKPGVLNNDGNRQRFMFVRDPYKRLLSGYIDKLLAPNPVYWDIISRRAISAIRKNPSDLSKKCGHDLEFNEYVKYVILALSTKKHPIARKDGHFEQMTAMCKPCSVRYDFIGKLETFGVDSMEVVKRMDMPTTQELLNGKGGALAADDAIRDTCHQPFDEQFKKLYLKCITFYEALQRAWKKLQVRGLIGQQELPVSESEAANVTHDAFLQMAFDAHAAAPSEEKKKLQRDYFLNMFSTVSRDDLELVRKVYADDFKYFEYDDRPAILFNTTNV